LEAEADVPPLPQRSEVPGPDGGVRGIERGGRDLDPDLVETRLRKRDLQHLDDLGPTELPDDCSAHGSFFLLADSINTDARHVTID
jgi:hypothetical protein